MVNATPPREGEGEAGPGEPSAELERLRGEVASLRAAIGLLHRIGNLVADGLALDDVVTAVLTSATAGVGLGLNRAMLFLVEGGPDGRGRALRGAGAVGPADREEADRVWRAIEASGPDLEALREAGRAHRESRLDALVRSMEIDPAASDPVALAFRERTAISGRGEGGGGLFHPETAIAAPLRSSSHERDRAGEPGEICGVLYGDNVFTGRRLDPTAELVFTMMADHAGRALGNARRFEELAGEARTDALTGLRHHGAFMSDLGPAVAEARRDGRALGLLMIDLDGFKQINDRLGHLAGDALLSGLASRMRGVLRGREGLYRYGGDEFAAILPGADRAATALVAERLREAVSKQPFAWGRGERLAVTCSLGAASLPEDAVEPITLIAAADCALLEAKAQGKNKVVESR